MLLRIAPLAAVAALAVSAWGQAAGALSPYTGTISGSNVMVRAAPQDGYPCTKLSAPATVQVVGEVFGWLKIIPPEGCFSLIAKQYVQASGNAGTVKGANVMVRAGSELMPQRVDVVQAKLNSGDKVAILGEQGDYYRIVPPPGAYLWVSSQYVHRAGESTPVVTLPPTGTGPAVRVEAPAGQPPRPTPPTATARAVPPPPPVTPEQLARRQRDASSFGAAEKRLVAELEKPASQRDWAGLLKQYQTLDLASDSPYATVAAGRIKKIQDQLSTISDVADLEKMANEAKAAQAELQAQIEKMRVEPTPVTRSSIFSAEGILSASQLFPGGPTGPKRWTIADPLNPAIVKVYVEDPGNRLNLDQHLGAQVGISGAMRYNEAMGMYVVEAASLQVKAPPLAPPKPETISPPGPAVVAPATAPEEPKEAPKASPPAKADALPPPTPPAKIDAAPAEPAPAATQPKTPASAAAGSTVVVTVATATAPAVPPPVSPTDTAPAQGIKLAPAQDATTRPARPNFE